VPWRNAVFLFVNVLPGADAPYPNAFLDGGRRITWCAAHRRLPRLLQAFGTLQKTLPDKGNPQACTSGVEGCVMGACMRGGARLRCILAFPPSWPRRARRGHGKHAGGARAPAARCSARTGGQARPAPRVRYPSPAHSARHPTMQRLLGRQACAAEAASSPAGERGAWRPGAPLAAGAPTAGQPERDPEAAPASLTGAGPSGGTSPDPTPDPTPGEGIAEDAQPGAAPEVLLFCRRARAGDRGGRMAPFVACGRLGAPAVDWAAAGGHGEVVWALLVRRPPDC